MHDCRYRALHGYTLIEAVVVVLIIAILAIYAAPSAIINPTINLAGVVQQFANDARYAQTLAMTQAQRYGLIAITGGYQIINASGTPVTMPNGTSSVILPNGYSIGGVTGQITAYITFDNFGVPYYSAVNVTPGTPMTTASGVVFAGPQGMTSTVTVTPNTGRVTIS